MNETPASMTETRTELPEHPMPRAAGCPFDPPPELSALRTTAPLSRVRTWDGATPWLVTRHDHLRTLLRDSRLSADPSRAGYPHRNAGGKESSRSPRSFIAMDDPEHARLRRMVTPPFAVRRIEAMRPRVQRIVDGLIDDMLAGPNPVDLVEACALPLPSLVICELLGVPYERHDFFERNTRVLVRRTSSPDDMRAASQALADYLEELVAAKRADPGDDLLSALATQQVESGALTQREAAAMGVLLLIGGHETTANMIILGTLALLRNPGQLALLRDTDDPSVVVTAVEEMLRYLTITHSGRRRVATADITIGGQVIKAGDGLILANDAANRDPEAFPDPDRLDLTRNARHHLAFGYGVHQCLGQQLAHIELQAVYGTLYRRLPGLAVAIGEDQLEFKHDGLVYGLYALPVTW
ncbi:cytochrome P450 [Streptomyces hygroscopicus]|uniref:cytochrome P450 n=1 Tax=Streptomyces hygroscopicus TaxID=1912 RepID=UPI0036C58BF8